MDDPFKYTTLGHARHRLCSPLSDARLAQLIEVLDLPLHARTLDLAGGKGELSLRLAERYGSTGIVVDRNPSFLADGRVAAEERAPGTLRFVEAAAEETPSDGSFDLVICVGARPFGDRVATLRALAERARPGGEVLVGEGYYRAEPPAELLDALGEPRAEGAVRFADHLALAESQGLIPLYTLSSTVDELDHYDGLYRASLLRYVEDHPDDPDVPAIAARVHEWRARYYRWVRDFLGFGWYLYRKAGDRGPQV